MALTISINQAAAFTVNVGVPGPTGATGPAGPVGPVGPAGAGGIWGQITGTLSSQTDLATALAGKYSTTNPAGYIDLTTAGLYFYPLTGNPGGFATQAWVIGQNYLTIGSLAAYATMTWVNGELAGYALQSWVTSQGYITASALSPYLTSATAASTYAVIAAGQPISGTVGQVLTKNSGTNYDSSWTTIIPGDRYLTTSTTSLAIDNANKTLTVGTGLSYTPTQNLTISYDASHHMHGEVLTYNSGTGVLTVDINNHTGSGTFASWVVNVGGVTPATSVAWGAITGTLGNQTDLATALNNKLEVSTAASTYYLQTNPAGFITSAALTGYATEGWVGNELANYATLSYVNSSFYGINNPSGFIGDAPSDGSTYGRNNGAWVVAGGGGLITSVTSPLSVTSGDLSVDLSAYLPLAGGTMTGDINMFDSLASYNEITATGLHAYVLNGQAVASASIFTSTGVQCSTPGSGESYLTPNYISAYDEVLNQTTEIYGGQISIQNSGGNLTLSATGLTFPDATVQTTAALPLTGGAMTGAITNEFNGMETEVSEQKFKVGLTAGGLFAELNYQALTINNSGSQMTVTPTGLTFPDASTQTTAATNFNPAGYATESWVYAGFYPLSGNPSAFLTDAPNDGATYARQNLAWTAFSPGLSSPPYSEAVWAYNNWYQASVRNVYDPNFGQYYNVLAF